jgi:ABC-2 type transport system permease protein
VSELKKLQTVINYEFLKHIRRKRLYVILLLVLISEAATLIGFQTMMGGFSDNAALLAVMLSVGPSMAAFGAIFFSGDAIAGEFESKTGFLLFTNPVKRTTLVLGKYIAGCMAVAILVIFAYAVLCISLFAVYQTIPPETAQSFGLCLLYSISILAVTFLFSSLTKSSMSAIVITLVLIMVISGTIESILMLAGKPYWFLISAAGDGIALVYEGNTELILSGLIPMEEAGNFPFEIQVPNIGHSVLAMVIYLVGGLIPSLIITNRRELS